MKSAGCEASAVAPKNENNDSASDNFCLTQSIQIRSINRFENGLQVNDSYVIPKGSIFIHGVSIHTGEPINFVAESLLPTDDDDDIDIDKLDLVKN